MGAGLGTWFVSGAFVAGILAVGYAVEWWAERRDKRRDCACPMCRGGGS